jgi:hypothetical protein
MMNPVSPKIEKIAKVAKATRGRRDGNQRRTPAPQRDLVARKHPEIASGCGLDRRLGVALAPGVEPAGEC